MKFGYMKSKKIVPRYWRYVIVVCTWLVMSGFAMATYPYVKASDSRFEFLGTWKMATDNADAKYTIYPGSTVRIRLEGTAWLDLRDYNPYDAPHVRVRRLGLNGGTVYTVNNTIKLEALYGPVEYELIFTAIQGVAFYWGQHAYHNTSLYFKGLWLKTGSTLHHATIPDGSLKLDFLGDSITHGVRILRSYGDNVRSQDASQCFGYYLARALHAPYRVRGHSGESTGGLTGKVDYFQANIPLDSFNPDYIFVNIGANDVRNGSSRYLSELETLLTKIRQKLPNTYIYVLDFFSQYPNRVPQIKEAINRRAAGHATYFNANRYIHRFTDGIHPDGYSHARLAKELAQVIGPSARLVSPLHEVVVSKRPTFNWHEVEIAESYKILIHRNGKSYLTKTVGAIDEWTVSKDLPRGDYEWWIHTRNSLAEFRWSQRGQFKILPYIPTDRATLVYPSGNISPIRKPTFTWNSVDRATDYYVLIYRNGKAFSHKWVKEANYVPDEELKSGNYKWWIRSYNADGYGPWSAEMQFEITYKSPEEIDIISPRGVQETANFDYEWSTDIASTWYRLVIHRNDKEYKDKWYYTGVTTGVVDYVGGEHTLGKYKWWIQPWGPDGLGPWSAGTEFSYGVPIPITPIDNIHTYGSHEFSWTGDLTIPWYQLSVQRDKKNYDTKWVQSTNWIFATRLPYGKYKWWVRSWKDNVYSPWSDATEFRIGAALPLYPVDEIPNPPLELQWDDSCSSDAEWYRVIIHKGTVPIFDKWVIRADTLSGGGIERSITDLPVFTLPYGNYTWWIIAWNHSGLGPWSEGVTFTITN